MPCRPSSVQSSLSLSFLALISWCEIMASCFRLLDYNTRTGSEKWGKCNRNNGWKFLCGAKENSTNCKSLHTTEHSIWVQVHLLEFPRTCTLFDGIVHNANDRVIIRTSSPDRRIKTERMRVKRENGWEEILKVRKLKGYSQRVKEYYWAEVLLGPGIAGHVFHPQSVAVYSRLGTVLSSFNGWKLSLSVEI